MTARIPARVLVAWATTSWTLLALPLAALAVPVASADPCSDVAVVFARGTHQEPGLGNVGEAFVQSLTAQVNGKSVDVYAVNYPASDDYHGSSSAGAGDATAHIQNTVANCPNSKIVLGGYSQGSTVIDLVTTQLPASAADHVAAVALFGEPSSGFSTMLWGGQTLPTLNPIYGAKTISLCAPDDPICSPGGNMIAHVSYVASGMTNQAATFAATKLGPGSASS